MIRKMLAALVSVFFIMTLIFSGCDYPSPAGAGDDDSGDDTQPQSSEWLKPIEKVVVTAYSREKGFTFSTEDSQFVYFGNPFFGGAEPSDQEKHKVDLSFAKLENGHLNWKHSEVVAVKPLFADAIYAGDFVGRDLILVVADKNQDLSHAYQLDRDGQKRFELDIPGMRARAATLNQSGQVGIIGEASGNVVWACINTSFQLICDFSLTSLSGSPKLIVADPSGNFAVSGIDGDNIWFTTISPHGFVDPVQSVSPGSLLDATSITVDANGQVYVSATLSGLNGAVVKFPDRIYGTLDRLLIDAIVTFKNSVIALCSDPNLPYGSEKDMVFERFDINTLVLQANGTRVTSGYPTDGHTAMIRSGTRLFALSPIAENADTRGAFISMFDLLTGAGRGF